MSILLIDIGNTRLKWAVQAGLGAPLSTAQACPHDGEPAEALAAVLHGWDRERPTTVSLAHVTGAGHEAALSQAVYSAWSLAPRFARSQLRCAGLHSAYAEPARLGVDRWLAMLAIWTRNQQPFCVANAGTALTFDAVDHMGQHQGGVIAPGLLSMIDATLGRTRFMVEGLQAHFSNGLGRDTEACVQQGALHATAGLLDRLGMRHEGLRYLAGGDAVTLQPHLSSTWQLEPDLVLLGLAAWTQLASVD